MKKNGIEIPKNQIQEDLSWILQAKVPMVITVETFPDNLQFGNVYIYSPEDVQTYQKKQERQPKVKIKKTQKYGS